MTLQERLSDKTKNAPTLSERLRSSSEKKREELYNRLKTWHSNNETYVSNYQTRYSGLTGTYSDRYDTDSASWLEKVTQQKSNFDAEAKSLKAAFEANKDLFDEEWLKEAISSLDSAGKIQEDILAGTQERNKYWSQWDSEDSYNKWATYMKDREEKLSYDLGEGRSEIENLEYTRKAASDMRSRIEELESTLEARRKYSMMVGGSGIDSTKEASELARLRAEYNMRYKDVDFDTLNREINDKKAYYTLAERVQDAESLKTNAQKAPDFETYAAKGAAVNNPTYAEVNGSDNALGWKNPFAKKKEIENIVTYARDNDEALRMAGVGAANSGDIADVEGIRLYNLLKEEEVKIYNYYIGKGDKESASAYLESLTDTLNQRKAGERFDDLEGNTFLEVLFGVEAGVDQFAQGVANLFNGDDYIPTSTTQYLSGMVREDLADNGPKVFDSSLGQLGYDFISTTSNMLPSMLVGGGAGAALLGVSAAGNAKSEMLRLGYSKEQATAYGALVGASESLLEYAFSGISAIGGKAWDALGKTKLLSKLDNVLGNISVKAPSALVALGKTVGGMAGEAFEEGLQTIIEPWLESVVLGGDYEAPDWEEVAYSSLLGALSAAGLEGMSASVNVRQTAKTGREIQNIEGGIQKLVDTGHSYSVDTVAHKLAGKIEAAINEGKKVNAYSIGKLFIEEGATLSEQNKNDIKRGLAEMNWDENSANVMTETYARFLDESIELSQEAIDIFTENAPFTRAVVNKLIGENTTTYQRQKGYVDLERMVNGETSVKASAETETKTTPEFDDATVEAIKRVKADIEGDRNLLSADRSRKIVAEANKASAEDLARNALKVEGKYTSRGTGVTRLKNTHEKVSITDVVSTKDGNVRVRLNNNKVVDLAELDLASESDAVLYEAVARMGVDAGAAKLIVNGYDSGSGVSAEAYALGMAEAINNGKYNIKQIASNGFAAMLNPIQQKLGRDIGRMSAEATARAEQDAINAKVAKAKAEGKAKQVGGISYDASVDTESLTDTQKAQISVLEKVIPSLGVKVKFFASSVANEGGKRGFTTEDGQFTRSNGWYDPETGDIWVDVNAGADGKGLVLVTAAHELTHFTRQWSPAKYKIFSDFIISQYGEGSKTVNELVKERQDVAVERGYTLSYDEALEEVVARSCESFLQDSDAAVKIAALAQKDKSLAQKIKSFVGQLLAKIRRIAKELGLAPDSEEGKYIASMETGLQSLYDMWTDALIDAGRSFSRAGVAVDGNTESASPMFSERTWSTSEYVTERDAAARKLAESLGVSIAKAKKYIDNVNSIAKIIANDRVRLDYEASSFGSAFVSNVEYGGSFDYTTLCKKRRIYTGTFQEIQKRIGDEVLSPDDILEIRNMMIEGGIEATCGLCYVEGSRANMGKFAKEFIKLYKRDNPDGWTPTMVDVNTPDGVEQMRINHPEAYDQYQYFWDHYGKLKDSDKALFASQQKPKLYEARKEYKGEILQHFKNVDTIAKKNRNGGIRMQSFSDFEIVHLIDTMQVIMDMSQVGLAGQAYTKVPEFAEAFGNTGLKINLSLIAKDVDANGNLVFDNREGMPAETAFSLRDKYSANVGTIIVTFTDEQLQAAMADPRIDFIIPFHRSQWKKSQYGAMGLPKGTKDYTYMQNEKLIKPTYHEFRGRMVKDKASNYMPNEYWDFSKTGKENAEAYLEMCAAENKRPKFYKLLDYDGNGKYSLKKDGSTDGYWKLLIDFKMYDNDGIGSPQMPVAPDFSMDEAMTMLDEYKGGHQSYPIAHEVVDEFVKKFKAKAYSADFSKKGIPSVTTSSSKFDRVKFAEREFSEEFTTDTLNSFNISKPGDYIHVQRQVFNTLLKEGFFTDVEKRSRTDVNEESGMVIETNKSGIDETFSLNNYVRLGKFKKIAKLSTIRSLPDAIKYGHVLADDVDNIHNDGDNKKFAYLEYPTVVDGKDITLKLAIKKSPQKNKFWVHSIYTIENVSDSPASTNNSTEAGHITADNGGIIPQPDEKVKSKSKNNSDREDNVTEREILADTLMGAAANDIEKNKLKAYKAKVKEMEAEQEKLGKIKAQIKELSFAKGKRDTEKIKRLRELAVKTENRINIYDRQLLSLEATKPMRDLLERRVAEVGAREKAKATEKAKAQLSAVREQRDRKLAEQKAAFYDQKMRAAERHDKTSMRNKIRERVDSLNKLLLNPTKEKHIPMNLQKPVAELLSIINMESSDNEKVKAKLQVLKAEYEAIAKSEDPVIAAGYHPDVAERIGNVAEVVGDTALKDMNLEQLDYLYETLTIVENVVRNANKGFKIAKGKTITDYGLNVMQEILDVGGKDHMSNDTLDAISRFKWANLKPVYAFERIGSNTFTELFNNVRAGEDTWATDVSEARAFFLEKAKKYKYFDWDLEKTQEFSGKFGKKFELTLPQMMSLYAYSKRKQADLHLEDGGFVFEKAVKVKKKRGVPIEYTVKVADPFSLRKEHLAVIVASLTDEQRAFVDEMQTYLSSVMGAKGNEVAREMYGIDLFKETDYFPLKSSSYYLAYNPEKDAQSKVKNYGMAKETVKNANNPIILSDFMDVWGKHVDEMSMYHAFVLPMEDFSKVFNFNTPTKDDGGNKTSVQSRLTNAYGDEAVRYIKNLLTDLNGGARSDPNLGIINRLVGMFKKAKVFLSASVVIQQPSSIGRAFAVINPKYFTPNLKQKHGDAWNELKKYAPIATIKEMGYFDTNVGQSTVDYITGRDYNTLTEKIKGIATDKNYRDEAMGKLPALADEMAWIQIWNAAKNEIADTTDLKRGTEEFLNAAGKRFTEAVVKTQVYDSVLSRSAWMRSKDGLSKMLTSFLAEPTTTANMMSNAVLQASRGNKKHFAATLGAVMTSIVMNSMLVSLVYAARDDDEDEAFTEKYVESLVTELIEGGNPATYLPIVKDIWSLLQGYDVERSDMSLIADLIDAIYGMLDDNKDWEEKIERLAVTLADMSGVPLNNVIKDIRAAFRFGSTLFDDIKPTDIGMEGAIKDAVIDSVPFLDKFIKSASKSDKLYKAITSGSEEDLERAESAYKTDSSLETAIKKGLRENDSRVKEAALALYSSDTRAFGEYVKAIAAEGNFDSETVEAAVRAEASAYETKIEGASAALEDGDQEAYKDLIRELRKAYKGILSQDEIVKAISEYEKPAEEAEDGFEEVESIYKTSDINTALESGDTDHALEIVKEILEVKVENNLAKARLEAEKSGKRFVEKKALKEAQTAANASVRSSLTSYWKKRYLEAFEAKDYAETERIRRLLHSTGVYGKLSELDADLKEWRKNN